MCEVSAIPKRLLEGRRGSSSSMFAFLIPANRPKYVHEQQSPVLPLATQNEVKTTVND